MRNRILRYLLVPALAVTFGLWPSCTCEELPKHEGQAPTPEKALVVQFHDNLPPITSIFVDDFNRGALGSDWHATDPEAYRIEAGAVAVHDAHNHPLWLGRRLPTNAIIEFDCWSTSPDGDIKVEAWGDGVSHAEGDLNAAYTSTAYNFIFGGWRNSLSTLARQHEHGGDRQTRADMRVVPGQKYHWMITRLGKRIDWRIDGQPFLSMDDPAPLAGEGHGYFAFTDWESELHFDNLRVTPLP